MCQFMFSYENKKLPYKFQEMFTLNCQIHNCNTRSKHLFLISPVRKNYRQFSVGYQGLTLFNLFINEIKQNASYHIFTKKLKRQLISNY